MYFTPKTQLSIIKRINTTPSHLAPPLNTQNGDGHALTALAPLTLDQFLLVTTSVLVVKITTAKLGTIQYVALWDREITDQLMILTSVCSWQASLFNVVLINMLCNNNPFVVRLKDSFTTFSEVVFLNMFVFFTSGTESNRLSTHSTTSYSSGTEPDFEVNPNKQYLHFLAIRLKDGHASESGPVQICA